MSFWILFVVSISIIIALLFVIAELLKDVKWYKEQWLLTADALFKMRNHRDELMGLVKQDLDKDLIRSEFEANC